MDRYLPVDLPGLKDGRRKTIPVRAVGEVLGLETEGPVKVEGLAARAANSIQKVSRVELKPGLGSAEPQAPAAAGFSQNGGGHGRLTGLLAQDEATDVGIRARLFSELANYIYPKRKAVELKYKVDLNLESVLAEAHERVKMLR